MTARATADDIILAPATRPRGALLPVSPAPPHRKDALVAFGCDLVEAREAGIHDVQLARMLATAQSAPAEPLVHDRQQ